MNGTILKSSMIASAVGVIVIAAAFTAGGEPGPDIGFGIKGDILVPAAYFACPDDDCGGDVGHLGGYRTFVDRDVSSRMSTLVRESVPSD